MNKQAIEDETVNGKTAVSLRRMVLSTAIASVIATLSAAAVASDKSPERALPTALNTQTLVSEVLRANNVIRSKRMAQKVAEAGVDSAGAIFQPVATASASSSRLVEPNTPENQLLRSGLGVYDSQSRDASAGVSMLVPTGGKVEAKTSLSRLDSNVSDQRRGYRDEDYKSFYGLSLTQPLARDAGSEVTRSNIRIAEIDSAAAGHNSRETDLTVVSEAMATYYDLVFAQERVKVWEDSIKRSHALLQHAKSLNASGRLAQTGVLDVEGSLIRYEAGLNEARQSVIQQRNKLLGYVLVTSRGSNAQVRASDPLPRVVLPSLSFDESYKIALENRPDYRVRKAMIDREGVQIVYAKNQALPKIDLVATYGINGLKTDPNSAMGSVGPNYHDFPTWTLGLQASVPLGEDQKANAELRAAKIRKQDAILGMKALEASVANDIDTGINAVRSAYQRWEMFKRLESVERTQEQRERERFDAGRSDMRELLTREEMSINARTSVLEQAASFAKAKVTLELAQGTLLAGFKGGAK